MNQHWITTFSGVQFDLLNPTPLMVKIEDIAHGLSHQCRFNGQCRRFYSVAEHSLLCCDMLPGLQMLLHDASEAYLPDVTRPLKACLPDFKKIEYNVELAIEKKFSLPLISYFLENHVKIKNIDTRMLKTEMIHLFDNTFDHLADIQPYSFEYDWDSSIEPSKIKRAFLRRFADLVFNC